MATTTLSVSNGNRGKIYTLTYSVSSSDTATTVTLTSLKVGNSSWAGSPIIIRFYADSTSTQITSITDDGWAVDSTHTINSTYSWNKAESAQTKHVLVYGKQSVNGSESTIGTTDIEVSVPALAKYAVTYNANGGSGAPATQYKVYGKNLTLSTVKPTRSGFSFVKWFTAADGTGTGYNPGATYSTNAALNLYAKWSAVPSVTSLKVIRSDENGDQDDSGTYAAVTATWTMDSSTGESATVTGTITPQGGTSSAITLSGTTTGTGGTVTALVPNMDTDTQYVVAITAANGSNTATRSAVLTRAFFIMDFKAGGGGIGIGRAAPSDSLAVGYNAEFDGNVDIFGKLTADSGVDINGEKSIYWKEAGYGDKFAIVPSFSGADDANLLKIQSAVGAADTDPALSDKVTISGKSGNVWVQGAVQARGNLVAGLDTANQFHVGGGASYVWMDNRNASGTMQNNIMIYPGYVKTGHRVEANAGGDSWVNVAKNHLAGFYANKSGASAWSPALSTTSANGSCWSIGTYNNENLLFAYVTKANMDAGTNGSTLVNLPNNPGTIPVPVQLYYNATGVDGTITLSQTAANFNYLRIYFKKNGDSNACDSTVVYAPNGKRVSLVLGNWASPTMQIIWYTVTVSGTSISVYSRSHMYENSSSGSWGAGTSDAKLNIWRVEGWK